MQDKGMDFRKKEVINITDATRLGYVQDVCADLETGKIISIIVPGGPNKLLNFFSSNNDIIIEWNKIKCIGEDLILVEIWNKLKVLFIVSNLIVKFVKSLKYKNF